MNNPPPKNLREIQYALEKNLRELRCLHDVARISGIPEKTIARRLEEIVKVLPQAFKYPDDVCVRITNGDQEYRTDNYRSMERIISADIVVQGEKAGEIEIGCAGLKPDNEPLVDQNQIRLIDTVAERLGSIIEHCQAQQSLQESEEKFASAFRLSPAGIAITALEDGRIQDVNDAFLRITGYTYKEAVKLTTTDMGLWRDSPERQEFIQKLQRLNGVRNLERTVKIKTGGKRTVLLSADIIVIKNKPCLLTVILDITELKQSRDFLDSISGSSPLGVYVLLDGKLKFTNGQFQEITGYTHEELAGIDLVDIVPAADKDVVKSCTVYILQGEKPYPCEYRILRKSGDIKWVMQMVSPISYENKPAVMGTIMDITERKFLERKVIEYEELDKMKGDILATVSHELRTPLATIKGYTTMMLDYREKITKDEAMEYLITINNSADKLIDLVNNLLDTSRIDSGMLELDKKPASITSLIRSVVKTTSNRIMPHRIRTELPALPRLEMDVKRISQVVEKLIFNAAEYSPIDTEILVAARKKDNNIEVSVTDRGSVIPAKELKSIFDRMYRIEKSTYRGPEDMGLSLHICQRLVEAHGGTIRAESARGKGTTIRFTLPRQSRNKRRN
jgi:PAS domain S-box-containing protein